MICSECNVQTACYDSREHDGYRRRRYKCQQCGARFTTAEFVIEYGSERGAYKVRRFVDRVKGAGADEAKRQMREFLNIHD